MTNGLRIAAPRTWYGAMIFALAIGAGIIPAIYGDAAGGGDAPALGSPDFQPTAERPVGWRGDGSGRYPAATPPTTWSRRAKTGLRELRCQASKPVVGDEKKAPLLEEMHGSGACRFCPADWLVAGPFDAPKTAGDVLAYKTLPGDAELNPREGDKIGNRNWLRARESVVNLSKALGASESRQVGYLFTRIYAPRACGAGIRVHGQAYSAKFRLWLNGKPVSGWEGARHPLQRGWNRLLLKVEAPGSNANWVVRALLFAFAGDIAYETQNVAWLTPMPAYSYATPIVVGDKIFVTSEPNDLICLDKRTGRTLWMRSHPTWSAVTPADKAAFADRKDLDSLAVKLEELNAAYLRQPTAKINQERRRLATDLSERVKKANGKYRPRFGWGGGNCGPTPCSDGQFVWAWHGESGVLACCTLDGKDKYVRYHSPGRGGEHGINSSPVLIGDKIVLLGGGCVIAFDKASGDEIWRQTDYRHPCYSTLVVAKIGAVPVLIAPDGSIYRVSDGKLLQRAFERYDGECASATLDGHRYFVISRAGFTAAQLPATADGRTVAKVLNRLAPADLKPTETYPVGSPLFHAGLVYATHSGWASKDGRAVLFALSPTAARPLYVQYLDFYPHTQYEPKGAGSAASLALAGKHIYVMDNRGTTIVFEPGPTFKPLAKNTLTHIIGGENRQEVTQSTPIFEGRRMYYRAEGNLYCIEEK